MNQSVQWNVIEGVVLLNYLVHQRMTKDMNQNLLLTIKQIENTWLQVLPCETFPYQCELVHNQFVEYC